MQTVISIHRTVFQRITIWICIYAPGNYAIILRVITTDPRLVPSQWKTALLCNDISRQLGASLESALLCLLAVKPLYGSMLVYCWGRDKITDSMQTTFSSRFFSMKTYELWSKFHWTLVLRVQLPTFHHCFRQWLGDDQAISHYLNQLWLAYWHVNTSLGFNELMLLVPCVTWPNAATPLSLIM